MLHERNTDWKPNLFIAGFSKCGTTELCSLLSQHKDVFLPWEKEPNTLYFLEKYPAYFSGDKTSNTRHTIIESKDYQKMYSSASRYKYRIDATTSYTFDARFALLLKDLFPDAKVILALRDQKQRLISMYFHSYIVHREHDFGRWLANYFVPFADSFFYYDKLQAYHKAFGDDLKVIETKDLGSPAMHTQLFTFLDISPVKVNIAHKNSNYLGPRDSKLYRGFILALAPPLLKSMQLSKRLGVENQFNRMVYAADDFVRDRSKNKKKREGGYNGSHSEMVDAIPKDITCMLDEDYTGAIEFAEQSDTLLTHTS